MPNPFFRFKQFTVFHDQCAMKVGTDGVLLGAWADCKNAGNILDIGTGSGLIALMLAQRSNIFIRGIDLDEHACKQAQYNADQSPFSGRIEIIHADFRRFNFNYLFDLIVSNPPYFTNSLKPPEKERSQARHNEELPLDELLSKGASLLSPTGRLALILPFDLLGTADKLALYSGLSKIRETRVKPLPHKPPKRVLLEYSKQIPATPPLETEFCIEISRHIYSDEFVALTNMYYLERTKS